MDGYIAANIKLVHGQKSFQMDSSGNVSFDVLLLISTTVLVTCLWPRPQPRGRGVDYNTFSEYKLLKNVLDSGVFHSLFVCKKRKNFYN